MLKQVKMSIEELKSIIKSSPKNEINLPFSVVEALTKLGVLKVVIDDDLKTYLYRMDIEDLTDKEFNPDLLYDYGWVLSDDETYVKKLI